MVMRDFPGISHSSEGKNKLLKSIFCLCVNQYFVSDKKGSNLQLDAVNYLDNSIRKLESI